MFVVHTLVQAVRCVTTAELGRLQSRLTQCQIELAKLSKLVSFVAQQLVQEASSRLERYKFVLSTHKMTCSKSSGWILSKCRVIKAATGSRDSLQSGGAALVAREKLGDRESSCRGLSMQCLHVFFFGFDLEFLPLS